jgi:hypothetical protein
MRRFVLTAAAVAAMGAGLVACVTATPYQPAGPRAAQTGGYSDFQIDGTHWRVTFSGNSMTSRETVEKYLLYRAAELTLAQGFDWFETADRHTERRSRLVADPDPFYASGFGMTYGWGWRPYWRYYGGFGWRSWDPWYGDPFWARSVNIREITRYEASTEIALGKGPPPQAARVFDARDVLAHLGPAIVRPAG